MPAFSFKKQFVPYVLDGSKRQTIRSRRKRATKKGDTLYLYYGLRTKSCKKLMEVKCRKVQKIYITWFGTVFIDGKKLTDKKRDLLAYNDGFRHQGDPGRISNCSEIMLRWWTQTHSLPFTGSIIYW